MSYTTYGGICYRDVIKDDFGGKLPSGRPFRPRLSRGRGFIRGRVFTVYRRGKNRVRMDAHVRADAAQRPRGRISLPPLPSPPLPSPPPSPSLPSTVRADARNFIYLFLILILIFLVFVAGLERENFFSIFNFQFSIPKIPKIHELRGLRG
jgi:hypothetical protein